MIFVGDIGTKIILDTGWDITEATVMKIKYKKPDHTIGEWIATLEESTKISYTTLLNDLDIAGNWIFQAYIEIPGWKGSGAQVVLRVWSKI